MTNNDEIILDRDESLKFIEKMIHPDNEAITLRDKFLAELDNTKIVFKNGEIWVSCPDITLEEDKNDL